jgi:flagellar biosynthesis/type III secretory pathway chaperone
MSEPALAAIFDHGPHEQFIDSLRAELQEYGELLQLFDEQQNAILARDPDTVLLTDQRVEAQLQLVRANCKERESLASQLAASAHPPVNTSLMELLPLFRPPMRPLVEALALEVNQLITRARRRAQQNRTLLSRSIEVTQELLEKLSPASVTRTYSAYGRIKIKPAAGGGRLLERG